jgi:hypothetical protein
MILLLGAICAIISLVSVVLYEYNRYKESQKVESTTEEPMLLEGAAIFITTPEYILLGLRADGLAKRTPSYATLDLEERLAIEKKNPWGRDWSEELYDLKEVKDRALSKLTPVERMVLGIDRHDKIP